MTPKDVIDFAKEKEAKVVDVRFTDLPGQMHHFSLPAHLLTEDTFVDGLAFDGSSIRGFKAINESDMLLMPDPVHGLHRPVLRRDHPQYHLRYRGPDHPRNATTATRARSAKEAAGVPHAKSTGHRRHSVYFGPEAEFYIFNDVRYDQTSHSGLLLRR